VDHPATQAWKRERLQRGGIAIPSGLSFVPEISRSNRSRRNSAEAVSMRVSPASSPGWG
jgi:hypothetical protein